MEERGQVRYEGGEVSQASVTKLIQLLTSPFSPCDPTPPSPSSSLSSTSSLSSSTSSFLNTFLNVYPAFISPIQLLEKLILRFCLSPPSSDPPININNNNNNNNGDDLDDDLTKDDKKEKKEKKEKEGKEGGGGGGGGEKEEENVVRIKQEKQIPIRLKVIHVMRRWIDKRPLDFRYPKMIDILRHFVKYSLSSTSHSVFASFLSSFLLSLSV